MEYSQVFYMKRLTVLFLSVVMLPSLLAVDDRFYCHSCVSSSYRDCVWNPYTSLTKDCDPGDRACSTVILPDGHIYRGCSQDAECIAAGDGCVRCDIYSGCNIDRFPSDRLRCNICQSSVSASCRALPYPRQFEKPCVRYVPGDRCVTVFDDFNVSYRDCLSGVNDEDHLKCEGPDATVECVVCSMKHCNTVTVRYDDRCLRCTSNMTHCSNGQRTPQACSKPSEGKCFSRVDEEAFLVRGCWSDLSDPDLQVACENDGRNCAVCEGTGCNSAFLPENTLSCVQCDSRRTLQCAQMQLNDSNVGLCRRHVEGDRCFVRTDTDGSLQRGCVSDLPKEIACGSDCDICSGNNCNRNVYPPNRLSCYQCNTDDSLLCGANQQEHNQDRSLLCKIHRRNDGCYTRIYKNEVSRGCISDLKLDEDPCEGYERRLCRVCYENSCNYVSDIDLRNSGSFVMMDTGLLLSSLTILLHSFN